MFDQLIAQLSSSETRHTVKVSNAQHQQWQRQLTWYCMQGMTVGQSFCTHFGIKDYRLLHGAKDLCHRIINSEYRQ